MNPPILSRSCAQSGSSFGSKTAQRVARYKLSSIYSARRRTGAYFQSELRMSAPCNVRAPQTTGPTPGMRRRQLTPRGLSTPFSGSVSGTLNSDTPAIVALKPAEAFQTPRCVSVRTIMPAIAPDGGYDRQEPARLKRGKKTIALGLDVPRLLTGSCISFATF